MEFTWARKKREKHYKNKNYKHKGVYNSVAF